MSTIKTVATFIAGLGTGLAIAYLLDPEGSKKKIADIKVKLGKAQDMMEGKVHEYKETIEDLVENYSSKGSSVSKRKA